MINFIKYNIKFFKKYKNFLIILICFFIILSVLLIIISKKINIKVENEFVIYPKNEISIDYNWTGKLLFNDIQGESVFSKEIRDLIYSSKKTVDIAMYSIKNKEIVGVLQDVKNKSKIDINIIVPNSKEEQHELIFKDTNINFLGLGKKNNDSEIVGDLMHHKFIIIDKDKDSSNLIFGSSNLTDLQEKYDPGFMCITSDKNFIEAFKEEFNLLNNKKSGISKLRHDSYKPFSRKINYNNGFVEIWFSPGYKMNSIKYRILDLINGSEKNIKILSWQLNDRDIFNAISKKAKEGIKVIVLSDDYYLWTDDSVVDDLFHLQKNINKNIEVVSDSFNSILISLGYVKTDDSISSNFNSFLHHHTLIIDDSVILTGTNNWGLNGFYSNDESVIVTNVDWFLNDYNDYFESLYKKIKGKNLEFEIKNDLLILKEEVSDGYRIILYEEQSFPKSTGHICYDFIIKERSNKVEIPLKCNNSNSRIFLIDNTGFLIGSNYLNN